MAILNWLHKAIVHELPLKLLALLIAVTAWFYVMNTDQRVRRRTVQCDVTLIGLPEKLELVKFSPKQVKARIRGRLQKIEKVQPKDLKVVANMGGSKRGSNEGQLEVVTSPDNVDVLSLKPSSVTVWLGHAASDKFAVKPVVTGTPKRGYKLVGTPRVSPKKVSIAGSEAVIEKIEYVIAEVNINGLTERGRVSKNVKVLDKNHRPVSNVVVEPPQVDVQLPISQIVVKEVPVRARIGDPPDGYVVDGVRTSPSTVTLKGTPSVMRGISEVKTEFQSISDLRTTKAYNLNLIMPGGTATLNNINTVSVRVTVKPEARRRIEGREEEEGEQQPEAPEPETEEATGQGESGGQSGEDATGPSTEVEPTDDEGGGGEAVPKEESTETETTQPENDGEQENETGKKQAEPETSSETASPESADG